MQHKIRHNLQLSLRFRVFSEVLGYLIGDLRNLKTQGGLLWRNFQKTLDRFLTTENEGATVNVKSRRQFLLAVLRKYRD